ncbi:MAG: hypothetical protein Satyrvirus15_10 [Satyrvirus sp.]|uniref:C2H2-type domain-containing protein n=1 Tax=Satyrvirus sp. TaxID=2487771 RepID=A0A3G5AHZ7_9VIRU|nr:MAG: hypothetical protein Satyrvirus15_10 [Satyrvirus sp.]
MDEYKCKKCGKTFGRIYELKRHKNNQRDCVTGSKVTKTLRHACKYCKKKFSRKDAMIRHTRTCKKNKNTKIIKDSNNKNSNNKINGNENMMVNVSNKNNNNNVIYKNPTKNITINLIMFSKDGIKNLNYEDFKKIFGSNKHIIEELITQVNFNPDKPEHHNVYCADIKSGRGIVYEDNKWVHKQIEEILNTLLDAKVEDLNKILSEMQNFLNKKTRNKIKKAIEDANYDSIPPGSRKKLMKYIKNILYNNKDMIIKTKKLMNEVAPKEKIKNE